VDVEYGAITMYASARSEDRGVTNLLGYILAVGVFLMLTIASLSVGFGVFTNAQESAQRTQIQHNSQILAHSIEEVDRLSRASSTNRRVAKSIDMSTSLSGVGFSIQVVDSGGQSHIILETDSTSVSNRVSFRSTLDIEETTLEGGPVVVVRPSGSSQIKIVPQNDA
jgi:hypothetical protein